MKTLHQSPTDPAFVQNPYPFYETARATGPFFQWADYDLTCTGNWAAVSAIFRDRRFGREVPAEKAPVIPDHLRPFYAVEAHSMLELEPPRSLSYTWDAFGLESVVTWTLTPTAGGTGSATGGSCPGLGTSEASTAGGVVTRYGPMAASGAGWAPATGAATKAGAASTATAAISAAARVERVRVLAITAHTR